MPYKDPEKRKAVQKTSSAKYYAAHREEKILTMHQYHQKNRAEVLKRISERNRANGHRERPKRDKALPEIEVPVTRRWRLHRPPQSEETLIYFTTRKGFTFREIRAILKEAGSFATTLPTP
jgi:hypothetical protein